jgi:hypothetical protein
LHAPLRHVERRHEKRNGGPLRIVRGITRPIFTPSQQVQSPARALRGVLQQVQGTAQRLCGLLPLVRQGA